MHVIGKRRAFALVPFLLVGLASASGQPAQAPPVAGHWEGAIDLPGMELKVLVDLSTEGGAWRGAIDIPAQGVKARALSEIKVEGATVSFLLPGVPGNPTFKGSLSPEANAISGDFSQGGQTFPFKLERKEDPAGAAARALEGFPDFVRGAMKDWKVPGLAVVVVKDDKVVFAEGFGLRDVRNNLPVTRDTLFAIGSSSKAFTAMTLALLAEDGKLSWDTPVETYLPTFKLKDDTASRHMTPRDLVTHRSGLPRHDFVWYNSPLSRKEMFDRLQYLEPNEDFRAKWQYQNLMFLTAGYLAGEVAGTSWEDLVRTRIFEPLAMKSSNFSIEDSKKAADFALPYNEKSDVVQEIPFRNISAVGPAGSINSTASDMAQWVRLQVGKGTIGGVRVISEGGISEMHKPQVVVPIASQDAELTSSSYGLGWLVESYRGHVWVHHGGAIDGFRSQVAFVPREGVGVVVLSNMNGSALPDIVARNVVDRLLGLDPVDWSARLLKRREAARKAGDKAKGRADLDRKTGTRPAHSLDDYAGEYENPAYGAVAVARDGTAGLKATFHGIPMRLEHWHYETFRAAPDDPALAETKLFAFFQTNPQGDVDKLSLPLEALAPEIVFAKKPPARLSDAGFLKALAGAFAMADNPTLSVTFALKGGVLTASIAGQPAYDLVPYQGVEFKVKGLTGFSVRFILDAQGKVSEALLIQPDGVYTLKRKE